MTYYLLVSKKSDDFFHDEIFDSVLKIIKNYLR